MLIGTIHHPDFDTAMATLIYQTLGDRMTVTGVPDVRNQFRAGALPLPGRNVATFADFSS
jgi:hypothetical protein